ncbi:MAG: tyrosine-type recombinase/integrase [Solirubrobacterales bacterium]
MFSISKEIPESWEDALKDFLLWKMAEGVSKRTIRDYDEHIRFFFNRYPEAYQSRLKESIYEYLQQPVKPATYNLRLVYLKGFISWGVKEGIFPDNPLIGMKKRRDEGRTVNIDPDILTRLIGLPDQNTYAGLRDYALILMTLDCGIRPSEAQGLVPEDINTRSMEVTIRAEIAKTRVSRTLPLSKITIQAIRDLIKARHSSWKVNTPLFCSADGTPLNAYTWGDRLEHYSRILGTKIRPYDLRHSFALQFLRNGGHALALQRTLGHSDLAMTRRYISLTQEDLRNQHNTASPLNTFVNQRNRKRTLGD